MGEPRDINRAHFSPAAARRVLVALETDDAPAEQAPGHAPPGTPARPPAPLPRIDGYLIDRELGRGAGGVTYLAYKAGSEAKIALKVLHAHPGDGRASQRAWRELDTLQQVRVPSVPRLLDYGTTDHSMYIATEYIDGTPLSELYAHARPADLAEMRERVQLLEKIARAAHSLHERGVIHRDLKPSNVIVTPAATNGAGDKPGGAAGRAGEGASCLGERASSVGEPFIIDLGIALIDTPDLHQTLTQDGQPVGTPAFMAPEQARGRREEISTRSDIYSLGAIGYWLCTGETPHDLTGVTLHEAIRRVGGELGRQAREITETVPKALEAVLGKACSIAPAARYESAIVLADDARRWIRGLPVRAAPLRPWARFLRWAEARPALATTVISGAIAACIVGCILGALFLLNSRPAAVTRSADRRFAALRSLSGHQLHEWDAGDGCEIPLVRFLTESEAQSRGRKVAIQLPVRTGNPDAGYLLSLFDPRHPDTPLWTAPTECIPPSSGSLIVAAAFVPRHALIVDVFPQVPGVELVQCYEHPTAFQSALRVFAQSGEELWSAWHWGPLGDVLWLADEHLLVLLAEDWTTPWSALGEPNILHNYPLVVFALQPQLGDDPIWVSGPAQQSSRMLSWYQCVVPASIADHFLGSLRPTPPDVHEDGLFDIVWTGRADQTVHYSTVRRDGHTVKSWNQRDFDFRSPSPNGPSAELRDLPASKDEYNGTPPPPNSQVELSLSPDAALPHPIAHWTFDDPLHPEIDESGNGHTLTLPGTYDHQVGVLGGAIHFHAWEPVPHDPIATTPSGPSCPTDRLVYPGLDGFTLAMWLCPTSSDNAIVVGDHEPHVSCSTIVRLDLQASIAEASFLVRHEVAGTEPLKAVVEPDALLGWIHLAGVYETTPAPITRLYVNGEQAAATHLGGLMRTFERPSRFYVSGSWYATTESILDDVRLYDCALTPQSVWQLFQLGDRELSGPASVDE